jgi:hypothetical protein
MKLWFPIALLGVLCFGGVLVFEGLVAKWCSVFVGINFFCLSSACLFVLPGMWLKRPDGTLNPLSYALFLPLNILNRLSFLLATRISGERPADCVAENVWLGRRITPKEAATLFGDATVAVLDLTSEFQECARLRGTHYLCLPTMDHSAPTQARLRAGVDFIAANRRKRIVYVHCALGHGRSATVVAAWLLQNDPKLAVAAAIKQLQAIRSGVRLNGEQREALEVFAQDCRRMK